MRRLIPACALAIAWTVAVSAQDSTVKSRTTIKADDAKVVTMTGCLESGFGGEVYRLSGVVTKGGDKLTSKTKVETDVDGNDTDVKARTRTKTEGGDNKVAATSGTFYDVTANEGVKLAPYAGHTVEIAAVVLEPGKGDDDAEVKVQTDTKAKNEDAPDARVQSRTRAELPRGANPRLVAMSVKSIAPTCSTR